MYGLLRPSHPTRASLEFLFIPINIVYKHHPTSVTLSNSNFLFLIFQVRRSHGHKIRQDRKFQVMKCSHYINKKGKKKKKKERRGKLKYFTWT